MEVFVSPAEPGDRVSFDVVRWSRTGSVAVPDAEVVLRASCRSVEKVSAESTMGAFLTSDADLHVVASGQTEAHFWLAARYMLPFRPRKGPWPALRAQADTVHRVTFNEVIDAAAWTHWEAGARVREVDLGLTDCPFARGRMEAFEQGLWDGVVHHPEPEPRLVPVSSEYQLDIDALIAAEPAENLVVEPDGTRTLFLSGEPEFLLAEGPVRYGSGFVMDGSDPTHTARHFINPDTANLTPVRDEGIDDDVDHEAIIAAGLKDWFGLSGPTEQWDWPCQLWRTRP
ncbi:hypothetical protein [Ornithinimicrobium cerasi]|uniref:hypothetical protein n=1 Tax=Ornithinimicrobium cerasi TaxID=2248773 RepID=UPI000F00F2DE|nr:hypothetical protein [Ornithinimicrobium cerasi]